MSAKYDIIRIEIAKFTEPTKTGKLLWEKVPGFTCTYQTCNTEPRLIVSCCDHGCSIQIQDQKLEVPCDVLSELCSEITGQIVGKTRIVEALRTIQIKGIEG
jgi:hypothetical protein